MAKTYELVFDAEANGLLKEVSQMWMLAAEDVSTGQKFMFCDYESGPDTYPLLEYRDLLDEAKSAAGHYILGYDFPMMEKLHGYKPPKSLTLRDTLLMSQTLNYKRFPNGRHSVEEWGKFFGRHKPEHEDWSKWSPEMSHRCREDIEINKLIYATVMREFREHYARNPKIALSLRNEHRVLQFCIRAETLGWLFDSEKAEPLLESISEAAAKLNDFIEPKLLPQLQIKDKETKLPKWTSSGNYHSHISKYFGVPPEEGLNEFPTVCGPFVKIGFKVPDMGSIEAVKDLLYSIGWVPDDWTFRKEGRNFIKVSPKLTSSSLEPLGEIGKAVDEFYTLRSRASQIKGWLDGVDENGRVHGSCATIGTPTGRATHKGIVNVPGGEAWHGKEMRELFTARPNHKIIGADSSGNQMRAFCHYLGNDAYTEEVINGDVHTANMLILQLEAPETTRKKAKPFLYASN